MSMIGRPRKGFNVVSYNKQKRDRLLKQGRCPDCTHHGNPHAVLRFTTYVCPVCGETLPQPPEFAKQ